MKISEEDAEVEAKPGVLFLLLANACCDRSWNTVPTIVGHMDEMEEVMHSAELPVAMLISSLITGPAAYWIARSLQPRSSGGRWFAGILVVGILLVLAWFATFAVGFQFVPWNMYAPLTSAMSGCFAGVFVGPICFAAGATFAKQRHRDGHDRDR